MFDQRFSRAVSSNMRSNHLNNVLVSPIPPGIELLGKQVSIYTYREESLFVYLFFFCSSCIWTQYEQMQWNFSGNILSSGGVQRLLFVEKTSVLRLQQARLCIWPMRLQHSVLSENYWAAHCEQAQDMYPGVFEGAELESAVHLPRNLIGWPKTNKNSAAKQSANQTCVFGKKVRQGFLEAVSSN